MVAWLARQWRAILVAVLLLGSLGALLGSSAVALWGAGDDLSARERLREAAGALADAATALLPELPADRPEAVLPEPANRRFAALADRVLADYPSTEGGFYLARSDQFAGFAFPDDPKGNPVEDKKGKKKGKLAAARRDPPPMETRFIRQMSGEAALLPTGDSPLIAARSIGPSRVVVGAAPVGDRRPAPMAVWVMVRLSGPEQQRVTLIRLRLATGLSLGGILLALALAVGLIRSLRSEQRHRAKLRDELRQAEHLATLGRLLAGVAHEVRNPLAAIRSTVQLWERLPEQSRTPSSQAALIGAVDRLNDLVSRLLLFARSGHETRRRVDLNAAVVETLELVRAQAGEQSVSLQAYLAPDLPAVLGAGEALRQVALNLITNALQATAAGGGIVCRTRAAPGVGVELTVSDTGPGVPEAVQARLFEPFFTTRKEGTGLGLALCREIVRQHGGEVTLEPTAGRGATFRVVLPAADSRPSEGDVP